MVGVTLMRYVAMRTLAGIAAVFTVCLVVIFIADFVEVLRLSGKAGGVALVKLAVLTVLHLLSYAELALPFTILCGTIGAFLLLSKSSEIVIAKAAGISIWQFLVPAAAVALCLGLCANYLFSPLAALGRAASERYATELFGGEQNLLRTRNAGSWIRQQGSDGSSIISAGHAADRGLTLADVTVLQFDDNGRFVERIDARKAELQSGYWALTDAWVARPGDKPELFRNYQVSTRLSAEEADQALGSVYALSYFELPKAIELAENAGLSATRYRVQLEALRSRPALFLAMVLLAATVSLRAFRFGNVQTKVVVGIVAGFGFFILAEVSSQVGAAGHVFPFVAAWAPIAVVTFSSLTVLLHLEDG